MVMWFEVDNELCSVHRINKELHYIFYSLDGKYITSKVESYE